jgi:hypothetical protein
MYAHSSHGFRGGGGPTQASTDPPATDMVIQVIGTLPMDSLGTGILMQRIHSTLTRDTDNKLKEVKSMWWPRGRRCWWWYMYPYSYPPYPPYVQAPQQPSQPAQQPTQQPPVAPYYPLPPFMPPPPTPEQEIEALEAYKAEIDEELKGIEARIKELKESLTKESGGQLPETRK